AFQQSIDLCKMVGDRWKLGEALVNLGHAHQSAGHLVAARQAYLEALYPILETHTLPVGLDALMGLAEIYNLEGTYESAFKLLNFVLQHEGVKPETHDR